MRIPLRGTDFDTVVAAERSRIQVEYQRRTEELDADRYAPWQPAEVFTRNERKRAAVRMLREAGVFPKAGDACLEIGFGTLGWLADLISWGVRATDLHGMELDPARAERARAILPGADLQVGDACRLPWDADYFRLVVASTVFTSILDARVRSLLAEEATRVLAPGGAIVWYDFAVNNPSNPHVRKVGRRELGSLFPRLHGKVRSLTLAPPLARLVAPRSWLFATCLEAIPLLRTHLMAVLIKP